MDWLSGHLFLMLQKWLGVFGFKKLFNERGGFAHEMELEQFILSVNLCLHLISKSEVVSSIVGMEDFRTYININPNIRFGKPCIVGTRIAVSDILGWLASDMSYEEILEDFPQLKREHIRAALAFAAERNNVKILPAA